MRQTIEMPGRTAALVAALAASVLAGCSMVSLRDEAEPVRIVYSDEMVSECRFVDNVVGSEGHWYNSWFIGTATLTRAALNDLRNQASEIGADTVFIPGYASPFRSSITIIGQAFFCGRESGEPDLS